MAGPERPRNWRRSSASGSTNCLEVAFTDDKVFIRNSPHEEIVSCSLTEWTAFVMGVRVGEFDVDTAHPD
jgi:hypothetical protein